MTDLQEAKSRFVVWVCPECGFYDCDPILRRVPGETHHGPMRCFRCGRRAIAALDLSRVAKSAQAWHQAQARETAPMMVSVEVVPRSEAEAAELLALRLYDLMRDDDAERMTEDDVEFVLRLREAHPRPPRETP